MAIFKKNKGKDNQKKEKILTRQIKLKPAQIVIGITIIAFVLFAFIWALSTLITQNSKKLNKENSALDPELARAMTYEQYGPDDDNVEGTDNVKFGAFFLRDLDGDGNAERIKGTCKEIGTRDTLYMEIKVLTEGRLNNARIQIEGKNFNLATALPRDQQIKNHAINLNTREIEFNDLLNGTQKLLSGVISFSDIGNNINNYTRNDNKIILTGTYVDENGTETEIRKEVLLTTDWYGTTSTVIENLYQDYYSLNGYVNEANGTIDLSFIVNTRETDYKLAIAKNHVEIRMPEFNGYSPSNVIVTNPNVEFNYDDDAQILEINRVATVAENGQITKTVARDNSYTVKVQYPIAAYDEMQNQSVELLFPIEEYYDGFNNRNSEFTNPYRSNVENTVVRAVYYKATAEGDHFLDAYGLTIGEYIGSPYNSYVISKSKPMKIYNGVSSEENDDTYKVSWYYYRGDIGEDEKIVLKEYSEDEMQRVDNFLNSAGTYSSMEGITTNKGIFFSDLNGVLEEDGEIKVFDDESGNLLLVIDKTNLNTYNNSNRFYYDLPVEHVRVEITGIKQKKSLYVHHIKEINDEQLTNVYSEEEFRNLKQIRTTLTGRKGNTLQGIISKNALYELPVSVARISLSKDVLSTQKTENNDLITITAEYDDEVNELGWVNGTFLVKLPDEILETEINEVTVNNSNVIITAYEYFENDQGKFIKIFTSNDSQQHFSITISCNLSSDPRIPTTNRKLELYAINEEGTDYYYNAQDIYDINKNLNTTEMVNKTTCGISLVAPNSLLTNQTLSEFDEEGTVVVSPNIADISPKIVGVDNSEKTAKIGVQIKNNYSSTISDIVVIGKIPFEGNTSVLTGQDLESSFTTRMLNTGIEVPANLQGQVDVYYSTNENPSKDLSNTRNNWLTYDEVEDWSAIKTFLIDFKDAMLSATEEEIFYYKVAIPNGLNYNLASYSQHGIWFSLNTDQGSYRTQIEPTKTGIRIADKYNLELTKYQIGTENKVNGATYRVREVNENNEYGKIKTGITVNEGKLTITGLYLEQEYELKEIKSPRNYLLNENTIRFVCHINENGELEVEKKSGVTRENFSVTRDTEDNQIVTVGVEDEAKVNLKIRKKEKDKDLLIPSVKYRIEGRGIVNSGNVITTNANGEARFEGLIVGEEYTITETKAEGYYINDPIVFKVVNGDEGYEIEIIEGVVKEQSIEQDNDIPLVSLDIENEKIPKGNLIIHKIKAGTKTETDEGVPIEGAKFELYKGNSKVGEYTSDSDGKIYINDLYVFQEDKNFDSTYTLVESYAPEGYVPISTMEFRIEYSSDKLDFYNDIDNRVATIDYQSDMETVEAYVEDCEIFKLIKKDEETGEVIPHTKFAIYNLDDFDNPVPARDSKGELVGIKQEIAEETLYLVETDENGEIEISLPEGFYKAVEVEPGNEQYNISEEKYFGIGKSQEGRTGIKYVSGDKRAEKPNYIYTGKVVRLSDGGSITIYSSSLASGNDNKAAFDFGNGVVVEGNGATPIIVRRDADDEAIWAKVYGGLYWNENIIDLKETSDQGFLLLMSYQSSNWKLDDNITIGTQGFSGGHYEGLVVKYDYDGNVEWYKDIEGSPWYSFDLTSGVEVEDGFIMSGDHSYSSVDVGDGHVLVNGSSNYLNGSVTVKHSDSVIFKVNNEGQTVFAQNIGGLDDEIIRNIVKDDDGGYIVFGYSKSDELIIDNDSTTALANTDNCRYFMIKYNANNQIVWKKWIGSNGSYSISKCYKINNRYYLVGSTSANEFNFGNVRITKNTRDSNNFIIVLDEDGEAIYGKNMDTMSISGIVSYKDKILINCSYSATEHIDSYTISTLGSSDTIVFYCDKDLNILDYLRIGSTGSDSNWGIQVVGDDIERYGNTYGTTLKIGNDTLMGSSPHSYGWDYILHLQDYFIEQEFPNVSELEVLNNRKEYNIVTRVERIDGVKGGTISGDGQKAYEIVKHGDDSTKTIQMVPNSGYEIVDITVNGQEWNFEALDDGTYVMPQFSNVTEDKLIVVRYVLTTNKVILNKVDSVTNEKIPNVTLKLDQLEEREEPENVIGELTNNGQTYYLVDDKEQDKENDTIGNLTDNGSVVTETVTNEEIEGRVGEFNNNGTYYFVSDGNGSYIPTNGKTYQTSVGGTTGVQNSTANSYVQIDLTGLEGTYAVVVNAQIYSESGCDIAYATITQSTDAPSYSSSTGRFIYSGGNIPTQDYTSSKLTGGNIYYLHFGYKKDGSVDSGSDQIKINYIKVFTATDQTTSYSFVNNNGKYESTNIGKHNTVCNSYIPIDLTGKERKISSDS